MARRAVRGYTIVELMIGTAAGLAVAAAATAFATTSVRESRALQAEARLTQGLRTAADIVARDLRRAGYWAAAASALRVDEPQPLPVNPYAALTVASSAADGVRLAYSRDAAENDRVDANEEFGFRVRSGVLEMQLGSANWQALTDAATLVVTRFDVAPRLDEASLETYCERPCTAGDSSCPPRVQVRSWRVSIAARSSADANVVRSLETTVRGRNDTIVGRCAA